MSQQIRIDPHVHSRGEVAHTLELAERQGVTYIFDMPNTDPPIIAIEDVVKRLELVPAGKRKNYFLWVGLTANAKQIKEAAHLCRVMNQVIGLKLYAGKSTGNLAVVREEDQKKIYAILASVGYEGVIAVHCEKEKFIKEELFNASNPITHCLARPKKAEIASAQDQIRFVKETNFKGILHICHASCPETVDLVDAARGEIKITCEATPHHVMWDKSKLRGPCGSLYKTNPPLRCADDRLKLQSRLIAGKIDWIATDHAPHSYGEKLHSMNPPSGYPSLHLYRSFIQFLRNLGLDKTQIKKLTYTNICRTFGLEL